MAFEFVFAARAPYVFYFEDIKKNTTEAVPTELRTVQRLTKDIPPGIYILGVSFIGGGDNEQNPSEFIGSIYLDGRLISATGGDREWVTADRTPTSDWYQDYRVTALDRPVRTSCPRYPAWSDIEATVRFNGSDARWIGTCGESVTTHMRLKLTIEKSTPTVAYV
jgi:hypothetical protein